MLRFTGGEVVGRAEPGLWVVQFASRPVLFLKTDAVLFQAKYFYKNTGMGETRPVVVQTVLEGNFAAHLF